MARIRVFKEETRGEDFPRLCVRCGEAADTDSRQTFAWQPGWVHVFLLCGLFPWLLIMLIMRKTMRVTLPVCHRHRNDWLLRRLFVGLGLLFFVALGIGLAILDGQLPNDAVNIAAAVFIGGFLAWIITAAILASTAVRAGEITADSIDLVGVSKKFADEWRESSPPMAPVVRRPRRRRRDDYDDEEDES
jgi:hypothetical protein